MTAPKPYGGRKPEAPERASHIELLFDVAFVFALSQTSSAMFAHPNIVDAGRNLLVIVAFWLVWAYTTWAANLIGVNRSGMQLILIMIMLGISLMGSAVREAFAGDGLIFAAVYVIIQIGRTAYMTIILRGQAITPKRTHMLVWFCITGVLWIAGSLNPVPIRTIIWAIAIVLTLGGSRFDFWLPWQGQAHLGTTKISQEHMAERYQQIIILALGEQLLAAGLIFSDYEFGFVRTTAFAVAFATTMLLWRIYFRRAGSIIAETISATRNKGRLTLSISYAHMIMFAGIMVTSVGQKIAIAYVTIPANAAWVAIIAGGPALFLIGRERLHYLTAGRLGRSRVIGLVILAAMLPAMVSLESGFVILAVNIVLGAIALAHIIPGRIRSQPTPPTIK